ncbi:nucleotidyl transferase AbiEii/AbiGii toxin family protein [Nocardia macrotermitis]|uniref:Nucleotidyl transferase AbiEii/AbiGii toxin family protein n=1 Tax=Nocardia macrotermitis TaxID=2585198 RepID=A0A7K0CXJ0_9NOCA|nr:nucleotidyl transferase AbiEii/AbiGii toxin family protein [Nocardia macrotermitis]MQY18206.1 hypothetical protein [Nocardia macrotermitis]
MSPTSRPPHAVRNSVADRIKRLAEENGQHATLVRRRFVIARFLARVFDADPEGWILEGGVGMMVRLPEARYSKDIDLLVATSASDPIDELRRIVRDHHLDHFRFEVGPAIALIGGRGAKVNVVASIGGHRFDGFSIDIVDRRRELVGPVERHRLPRLVDTDDFPQEASVQLYPLADQIADKICAMYETHGPAGAPSGRFRDLVDLLLISMFLPIDLMSTVDAVERERVIRSIPALPGSLRSPGPAWTAQWAPNARKSPLPTDYHELTSALTAAGLCYNRVLGSLPAASVGAVWNHDRRAWDRDVREDL